MTYTFASYRVNLIVYLCFSSHLHKMAEANQKRHQDLLEALTEHWLLLVDPSNLEVLLASSNLDLCSYLFSPDLLLPSILVGQTAKPKLL